MERIEFAVDPKNELVHNSTNVTGYKIKRNNDRKTFRVFHGNDVVKAAVPSVDAAKAAAQEHYVATQSKEGGTKPAPTKSGAKPKEQTPTMAKEAHNGAASANENDAAQTSAPTTDGATEGATTDAPASADATPTADGKPPKEVKLTELERKFVTCITNNSDGKPNVPVRATNVVVEYDNISTVSSVMASLNRKGAIKTGFDADQKSVIELTDTGFELFQKPAPTPRTPKGEPKAPRDPNAPSPMVAKYGERPADIGAAPTKLEYAEAVLENAAASLKFAQVHRRLHPYSPIAADKVKRAEERVALAQEKIDAIKAPKAADAAPMTSTGQPPLEATPAEAPADAPSEGAAE